MALGTPNLGKPKPPASQQQPMSSTAGPISAAMGGAPSTPPTPGSGAGNFTQGLSSVPTPNMKPLTPTSLNNATSIANLVQGYQNQANTANNQRYGQALGVMGQSQNSSNALYGAAQNAVTGIGQQATERAGLQEQKDLANVQQSGVNRGIGNTTIANTMQLGPERNYNDAMLGINEMQAKLQSGLDTQQAASQQQYGGSIAGLIGSRNDQAPSIGEYAQLAQGAAAGGNGAAMPHRSGSVMGSSMGGGGMGGGGMSSADAAKNSAAMADWQRNGYVNMGANTGGSIAGGNGGYMPPNSSASYSPGGSTTAYLGKNGGGSVSYSPGDPAMPNSANAGDAYGGGANNSIAGSLGMSPEQLEQLRLMQQAGGAGGGGYGGGDGSDFG